MKYKVYVEEIVITEYEVEANSAREAKINAVADGKVVQEVNRETNQNSEYWSVWDEKGNDLTTFQ